MLLNATSSACLVVSASIFCSSSATLSLTSFTSPPSSADLPRPVTTSLRVLFFAFTSFNSFCSFPISTS
ncbi:hypothetical protein PF008_g30793 [Phytophthora fragariae]|uniref:Uncharacterized protein n=1 Tax=Phytophthora fragariae TaxID=53985 RepID=A0A6G0Q566_9STRA|nr:hypothetical protein PF008_g30793 [Phytophthora fragariae]